LKLRAHFVTSAAGPEGLPRDRVPELAMVGRSNVGKSSLINALARAAIARTSAAPGKTRLANVYRFDREGRPPFNLVDLPGYGYARAPRPAGQGLSAATRRQMAADEFDVLVSGYFASRQRRGSGSVDAADAYFAGVLFLIDSRHPGLDADWRAWDWLAALGVDRLVVATKLDTLTQAERRRHLTELVRRYSSPVAGVSARTGEGLDELWKLIDSRLKPRPARP
jgi:GTP-binding protein